MTTTRMTTMKDEEQKLRSTLQKYNQEHLMRYWSDCNEHERAKLISDCQSVDFEDMTRAIQSALSISWKECFDDRMSPIPSEFVSSIRETDSDLQTEYRKLTYKAIVENKVGVILLAGGQGTRLGVSYPKGMFDIGLPSRKSLYQIQMERIRKLQDISGGGTIPIFVMTSEHTLLPTRRFFAERNYFGLRPENIIFFEQRTIPCFDPNGKIILETKYKIARAPDGNGGLYEALHTRGILKRIRSLGVEYLHVYCVDNVLVKVADPIFIGYCLSKRAEAGNKVVIKTSPDEAVGVVCLVDGKVKVVEYSEISQETAERRNSDGKLTFDAGNICNHFFTAEFLNKICENHLRDLPEHIAKKKIPFYDDKEDRTIKPEVSNGIKLEKFVFDVFEFADRFVVWDSVREDEFSPLKNSDSAENETPTTARNDLLRLHRKYLLEAGAILVGTEIEISPLLSYADENLEAVVKDRTFESPVVVE